VTGDTCNKAMNQNDLLSAWECLPIPHEFYITFTGVLCAIAITSWFPALEFGDVKVKPNRKITRRLIRNLSTILAFVSLVMMAPLLPGGIDWESDKYLYARNLMFKNVSVSKDMIRSNYLSRLANDKSGLTRQDAMFWAVFQTITDNEQLGPVEREQFYDFGPQRVWRMWNEYSKGD
jgi:hypothetical protein